MVRGFHSLALVTVLALIEYMILGVMVGQARGRYKIEAPATTGDPMFERYFRVHQNTLESLIVFLPALWICGITAERQRSGADRLGVHCRASGLRARLPGGSEGPRGGRDDDLRRQRTADHRQPGRHHRRVSLSFRSGSRSTPRRHRPRAGSDAAATQCRAATPARLPSMGEAGQDRVRIAREEGAQRCAGLFGRRGHAQTSEVILQHGHVL